VFVLWKSGEWKLYATPDESYQHVLRSSCCDAGKYP
jgi:hypothetical protein